MFAYSFALALAAALIDITLGYPARLERAIGAPSRWIASWLGLVRTVVGGWTGRGGVALYLAPILVAAALVAQALPSGPIGFVATAALASAFCGRQRLDLSAREVAAAWERDGPYGALAATEALGAAEAETRLGRASAAAIAARFADEVAATTAFILIGGLVGAAFCRAVVIAGRACREQGDSAPFARAVAGLEAWTIAPAARLGAMWIAIAALGDGGAALKAVAAPATTPTAPAQAAMLAALGPPTRDEGSYIRRALALFRRAAAAEMIALAGLALLAAAGV